MKCRACGYENEKGSKFCIKCGAKIRKKSIMLPLIIVGTAILILSGFTIFYLREYYMQEKAQLEQTAEAKEQDDEQSKESGTVSSDIKTQKEEKKKEIVTAEPKDASVEESVPEAEPAMEVWDIDIESEAASIYSWCYETDQTLEHYQYYDFGDIACYVTNGVPVKIMVKKGYDGWNYSREYYGHDIFYVRVYNINENHEFLFSESKLMRYIDEVDTVHDYGCVDWYDYEAMGERVSKERSEIVEFILKQIN